MYIVSNSNPKSLQTMNWNAMFHFLLFNTGFCNVIRTLGHKARMQQQPTVRKRKWKTHEKWELYSIGIGALATYITTHRGTMLCYSPFTLSTSWNELIHWSAVVTKFFAMVITNGLVECDEHKKSWAKRGNSIWSDAVALFSGNNSINYKYHQNYCPTNAVNISIRMRNNK